MARTTGLPGSLPIEASHAMSLAAAGAWAIRTMVEAEGLDSFYRARAVRPSGEGRREAEEDPGAHPVDVDLDPEPAGEATI